MEITSEFIFCEVDRRGSRRGNGLNPLQELQLIDILSEYISACNNETTKNTIFLSLFGSMESPRKLKILCILASMAVSASCTPVSFNDCKSVTFKKPYICQQMYCCICGLIYSYKAIICGFGYYHSQF